MTALIFSTIILYGCTTSENERPLQFRNFNQSNLTAEERQQMLDQRLKQATDACSSKSEGDACTIPNPRGEMTEKCTQQNGTLMCIGDFGGREFPANRRVG